MFRCFLGQSSLASLELVILCHFYFRCSKYKGRWKFFLMKWEGETFWMDSVLRNLSYNWGNIPCSFFFEIILWKRYVDDIFCVRSGTVQALQLYLKFINSLSRIEFSWRLRMKIVLTSQTKKSSDNTLEFDIHRKPTLTDIVIPEYSYHKKVAGRHALWPWQR